MSKLRSTKYLKTKIKYKLLEIKDKLKWDVSAKIRTTIRNNLGILRGTGPSFIKKTSILNPGILPKSS